MVVQGPGGPTEGRERQARAKAPHLSRAQRRAAAAAAAAWHRGCQEGSGVSAKPAGADCHWQQQGHAGSRRAFRLRAFRWAR
jgi:hypothetical protein